MDTRPPPFQAHPRPPSRSHEFPPYNVPPSPYNADGPRNIPPPPPSAPYQDPFLRPQRQTFESIAASTPRPDTRQAPSYAPPPPPYSGHIDPYYRDARDRPGEAREGYGVKRSHDQAMAGDHMEHGRPDPRRLQYDPSNVAPGHQHPAPYPHAQSHAPGPLPAHAQPQHAPEPQKLGNGNMYQPAAPRSPPPPSPYGGRPMPPPGSPPYAQSQYGPQGPPQGHLHLPPFGRDPGTSGHRSGSSMSVASMLGGEPPRPPPPEPYYGHSNGAAANGQPHYQEREAQRGGPPYLPADARSQTPERYAPRLYDYNRPSRAMSGGDRPGPMVDRSPEKYGFGPALPPNHHDHHSEQHGAPSSHPHNSAPGSRRQSVGGAFSHALSRPQTSVGASGPEKLLAASLFDSADRARREHESRDFRDHRDPIRDAAGRSIPPPMSHPDDFRNGGPHGPPERRSWEMDAGRPTYREEPGAPSKSSGYQFSTNFQQTQHHPHEAYPSSEYTSRNLSGQPPLDGPAPQPLEQSPDADRRMQYDARKASAEGMQNQYQPRLESPLQRYKHAMGRTQSNRSELTPSRLLSISNEDGRRAASPLPQAVQGAARPAKGPTSEPNIKNEFGRMFSGLGGVTPTPTPVELAHKRYSSPADEAPGGGRSTPGLGRLDLSAKRTNSRVGKRRKNKDDIDGDLESPTAELSRSLSNKGVKRTRNSYMDGLGIQRGETGSPFGAGRRGFTPNAFALQKRDRKPRIIVRSQSVLDSCKDKPRHHIGSMLYKLKIESAKRANLHASVDGPNSGKFDYEASPVLVPKFEGKENCTFTIRIGREYVSPAAREEVCARRILWGTEVYTDDTDPLAAAIHAGWIRGEWGPDVDVNMLGIGRQKNEREERLNSNAIGPNGRTSLSVSVSPELSRKTLAPITNGAGHGNTSGSDQGASRKNSDVGSGNEDDKTRSGIMTSVPAYPAIPPKGKDVHITLLLLPRLQSYTSTIQNGVKSRPWTEEAHDGGSFMIHSVKFIDEGVTGHRNERGPGAKHARMESKAEQSRGMKRRISKFCHMRENRGAGVIAAIGA